MEISDFFIGIASYRIDNLLNKEPKVKKWIQSGDVNLRTITGHMILKNPKSCYRIAENVLYFYRKAFDKTRYIDVLDLCSERIRLTNNVRAVIKLYL